MASENETVMAVCAEWRACIEAADPSVWNDERIAGLVKTTKEQQLAYLDRIEAAWKREKAEAEDNAMAVGCIMEAARHKPGNAAAMREALVFLRDKELYLLEGNVRHCVGLTVFGLEQACKIMRGIIEDALSVPPRQCDVGTPEEQERRFRKYCETEECNRYRCGHGCKAVCIDRCVVAWAQMPYAAEEGGAGDGV